VPLGAVVADAHPVANLELRRRVGVPPGGDAVAHGGFGERHEVGVLRVGQRLVRVLEEVAGALFELLRVNGPRLDAVVLAVWAQCS
jgi:hypothetical protein